MPDFSALYNTAIPPARRPAFEKWLKAHPKSQRDYYDYDVQGFWLSGADKDARGHGSDKFKKPNHPTFSVESKYSTPEHPGGEWVKQPGGHYAFRADQSNLLYHEPEELQRYFQQVEPGVQLALPPSTPGPAKAPLPAGLQRKQADAAAAHAALSNPIQTVPQLMNWTKNLIANPRPVSADSFFQTRITRTPGGFEPLNPQMAAAYNPDIDPIARIQGSNLPEPIKAKLMEQWRGLGKGGYVQMPNDARSMRPDALTHEQVHALALRDPDIVGHEADIAARISPVVQNYLERTPVYQREAQRLGRQKVFAQEGLAEDITDTSIPVNKELRSYVGRLLGPEKRRQLMRLSEER